MEIRLFDVLNNKVDVRDYMFIHEGKIMVNADHVYDVILDTDKVTLNQEMEMFDSKDEMFKKAKAFDEILNIEDNYNKEKGFSPCVEEYTEEVEDIISKYMEDKQND